jgi:hypothetical protein
MLQCMQGQTGILTYGAKQHVTYHIVKFMFLACTPYIIKVGMMVRLTLTCHTPTDTGWL